MPNPLHTPICDLLGCDYPVVLAGMGGVARADLVAAVTGAGGFGFLGMVREPTTLIRREVAAVRARTSRDFGVNLIPAATDASLLADQLETCIELAVPVVCLFWDLAAPVIWRLRDAGIIVVCQVGSANEAMSAQRLGAHAVIIQGVGAGGHVRGRKPVHQLLTETLPHVDVPVLAAGGLADGADLAEVLTLGASGAVFGTSFLATHESFAHPYHKQRVVDARRDDTLLTDAFHVNWPPGALVRVIKNSTARGEWGYHHGEPRTVIGNEEGRPIYLFSTDSPLRSMTGDFEAMALYGGVSVDKVNDVATAKDRVDAVVDQASTILGKNSSPFSVTYKTDATSTLSSPVCFADQGDDGYMGYLSKKEQSEWLSRLLSLQRDGARLMLRLSLETEQANLKASLQKIYQDKVYWADMLRDMIASLGSATTTPSGGGLYSALMQMPELTERLLIFNQTQEEAIRLMIDLLPLIHNEAIYDRVEEMLAVHEANIGLIAVHIPLRLQVLAWWPWWSPTVIRSK